MGDTFKYLRYRIRHALPQGNGRRILVTAFLFLSLPVALLVVRQVQRYQAGAASVSALLYFSPSEQNLPPDSNFKVMVDTKGNQMGFVRLEFSFDITKINLTSEVSVTSRLATVIQKTTMSEANNTGTVVVVAALTPTDRTNPLTGIVELANFNAKAVSPQPNSSATLSLNNTGIQLIDMQSQVVPFTSQGSSLTLNKSEVSTGTSTPVATLEPTTSVVTNVPSVTSTVLPSETPQPTTEATVTPTTVVAALPTSTTAPIATSTNAPTATATAKRGDVNGDNVVNTTDIAIIVDAYGTRPPSDTRADVNKDGRVDIVDIGIVIDNYGL
jgi:hypothetical protein